ncbi:MAG TPA: sulfite exporter TauE/SafE family protein [Cyclobacteriaceae bacterium]|jgi:uncharacterized membrane protein YfcA
MELFGYFASVCIGIILGLLGGGGSILSIPLLVYFFHLDIVTATAYSLFIVGITSLAGAIPKYRENRVNLQTGVVFGIPSITAIFFTRKWIVPAIPDVIFQSGDFILTKRLLLLGIFGVLMIISSVTIIRRRGELETEDSEFQYGLVILEGILIGFLTGLVGAGGGFLIIPALVLLTGLPFKTAVGTSLFIISINSLMGFLGDVLNYKMDWPFLLTISGLAVVGILVGNAWSRRVNSVALRKAFGWFTLAMGIFIVIKELTQA